MSPWPSLPASRRTPRGSEGGDSICKLSLHPHHSFGQTCTTWIVNLAYLAFTGGGGPPDHGGRSNGHLTSVHFVSCPGEDCHIVSCTGGSGAPDHGGTSKGHGLAQPGVLEFHSLLFHCISYHVCSLRFFQCHAQVFMSCLLQGEMVFQTMQADQRVMDWLSLEC